MWRNWGWGFPGTGKGNEGECVELKIFKLSTCFNIIAAAAADGWQTPRLFGFWGTKALRGRSRGARWSNSKLQKTCSNRRTTRGKPTARSHRDGCAEISPNGLLSEGAECAAREGADANQRTNDTMARDALPVNCCPAHSGFVYLSAKLTTGGKRRSTRSCFPC